jgi:DNA-binding FrmR family transcriptional regulator
VIARHALDDDRFCNHVTSLELSCTIPPRGKGSSVDATAHAQLVTRGYGDKKDAVQKRLRRIEGQVRGLQRMVDDDVYCVVVLTQISAATKALQAVAVELLEDHLGHCVSQAISAGGPNADAKIKEASEAIARLVKS